MTISNDDLGRITQETSVVSADGNRLGTINQIYTSDTTGDPAWVTVKTGLFGTQESFVPLSDAAFDGDDIRVAVSKEAVHSAPRVDSDGHLSVEEEDGLYRHYGLHDPGDRETSGDADRPAEVVPGRTDHGTPDDGTADDVRGVHEDHDDHAAEAGAGAAAGVAAAVPGDDRDDELAQRDAEGRDEVAEAPVAVPRHAQDDDTVGADNGTDVATTPGGDRPAATDDDAVKPGERTTRLRRYVVTERVVQTIEELPDEPGR